MRLPDFMGFMADGRPLALEAKRPGWKKPINDREKEQQKYLEVILSMGGVAGFVTSVDDVKEVIK
jgi:hypothetical protein